MEEKDKVVLPVSRRNLLKGMAAVATASAFAGCSTEGDESDLANGNPNAPDLREVRKVYSTCPVECLTHSLNCQLVGDHVVRVEPTESPDVNDTCYTTACGRGMARMQFLTENRVATPMKRIKKGTATSATGVVLKDNAIDQWVSISWSQAISEIGSYLKQLKTDGYKGILTNNGSGNMGPIVNAAYATFFNYVNASRTVIKGNMCCQGVDDGMTVVLGARASDTRDTIKYSKCILAWGNSPADTSNTYWKYFIEAQRKGAKIISIDPRYSGTAEKADQWIQIKPGTDTLVAIGMLRHIFDQDGTGNGSETWIDQDFLMHRSNAPYLVDLTTAVDDNGLNPVDFGNIVAGDCNKIYNIKLKLSAGGKPQVFDSNIGAIAEAEENLGLDGNPTQDPDLSYIDVSGAKVATVFQLMRALYAGDLIGNDLSDLHDPMYNDTDIADITGTTTQAIQDCAVAYASSGRKSMIIENMGGAQRTENGAAMCALHSILAVITGNVGGLGNGVDDTSGYGTAMGAEQGVSGEIKRLTTAMTIPAAPAGNVHNIPFGELGSRMVAANKGTPEDIHLPSAAYPAGTKDPHVKFWYISTLSLLTQYPNTAAIKEALRGTEMVVAAKPTWNTDADYCDYYLPVTTPFEYNDLGAANRNKYVQVMEAGVKPYGQAMSDLQIIRALAKQVLPANEAALFDKEDIDYVKDVIDNPANNFVSNGIANYDVLKAKKAIRPKSLPTPFVPYAKQVFNGSRATNKRAKIFITEWQSETTYPYPRISKNPYKNLFRGPFPRYIPAMESHLGDSAFIAQLPAEYKDMRTKYPLCNIQFKTLRSVHASFTGLSWIREAFGETAIVLMHPDDALDRGISDGDTVTVRSARGDLKRVARVTSSIMQGVTALENGWWDKYGKISSSTVVAELPDPMGCGHTHNNTLVEILKGGN